MRALLALFVLVVLAGCDIGLPGSQRTGGGGGSQPGPFGPGGGIGGGGCTNLGGGCGTPGGGIGGGGGGFPIGGGGGRTGVCGAIPENGAIDSGPAPAAISGGTMAAVRAGGFVVADPDRTLLWIVSADFQTVSSVSLQQGDDPGRVVEGSDGKIYVALRRTSQLAELDLATKTVRRLDTCALPRGLAWRATDSRLIVACLGGSLETLDPATSTRTAVITSRPLSDLRDVVVEPNRLLVTHLRSGAISAIDAAGNVSSINTAPIANYEPRVAWRAFPLSGGGAAVVRQLHRTSTLPDTSNCSAYGGAFATDARSSGGGAGGFGSLNVVQSELVTVVGSGVLRTPLSESFVKVVLPVDLAMSPSGRIAIVSAGSGHVTLLEPGTRRDITVLERGVDSQLTSVAFAGESAFAFSRQPAAIYEIRPDGVAQLRAALGGEASVSTGHELFHRATLANVACASCHPEAGEDGHTWNFLEGPRRTPSLRGGIGGTAPFHWVGDMANMDKLLSDVMAVRMRGPLVGLEGSQSVEDWLHLQRALPPPALDEAAKQRGEAVFVAAGCRGCHVGAQGTNNSTVDVGTGQAFQVPRLTEFAWRGPWFHDGRMQTLQDRFSPSAGGQLHGDIESLTAEQRNDLLVYLQSR